MKWLFRISWRNLWRNPRRTAVILVSVVTGIWMMVFMAAFMRGMVENMLESALANLTGHIQVHHPDYLDDPAVGNRIEDASRLAEILDKVLPEGSLVSWRVRFEVVAGNARHSAGLTLVGSDMETEALATFLRTAAIEGAYPESGSPSGLLVGRALLEDFETAIGNKLILTARNNEEEIASRAFRISGSFDTFLESSEKTFAFAPAEAVREFLALGETSVSEVSILLPDIDLTEVVKLRLQALVEPGRYAIHDWEERIPVVSGYLRIWDLFSWIWGLVVFAAMSFGLVNTLLMAVYERIREFGLVRALGMSPVRILGGVMMESCLLLLLGLLAGNLLAIAVVAWLGHRGIDLAGFAASTEMFGLTRVIYPEINPGDALLFNGMVFCLGLLVSLYPAIKAARFTPVDAMKHFN